MKRAAVCRLRLVKIHPASFQEMPSALELQACLLRALQSRLGGGDMATGLRLHLVSNPWPQPQVRYGKSVRGTAIAIDRSRCAHARPPGESLGTLGWSFTHSKPLFCHSSTVLLANRAWLEALKAATFASCTSSCSTVRTRRWSRS